MQVYIGLYIYQAEVRIKFKWELQNKFQVCFFQAFDPGDVLNLYESAAGYSLAGMRCFAWVFFILVSFLHTFLRVLNLLTSFNLFSGLYNNHKKVSREEKFLLSLWSSRINLDHIGTNTDFYGRRVVRSLGKC